MRDLIDLARRFRGYPGDGPEVARTKPWNHEPGDIVDFDLLDLDNREPYTVRASVVAVTEHAYFFVADSAPYTLSDIDQAASDFESIVWPVITDAFGEPTNPGVDGDPRITILHAGLRGAGGYVSGSDEYPRGAVPRSNEREMLYIEVGALGSGASYNALVAHELQHLIHGSHDENEESWINEGMSQVAWQMAGGGTDGVWEYLGNPDTQITFWPFYESSSPYYSAGEVFCSYVLDQYGGRQNAKALAKEPGNGINGVEAYLARFGTTFDDAFAKFTVANALDSDDGRYAHPAFNGTTSAIEDVTIGSNERSDVHQWGADYYAIEGGAFSFDGADSVTIGIPELDGPFWWSNRSDGIDSRLTRAIDLTQVESATLTFDLWTDIEPGWDFGYVAVSTDDGKTWAALEGDHTTTDDPIDASFGPGYTGATDGWVAETVDLSAFAGENALLRFEYVTDDATHLVGYGIDNIEIEAIGLSDSSDNPEGWSIEGFRRIEGPMPQKFIVQIIRGDGTAQRLDLDAENTGFAEIIGPATIVISGATRDTTEVASYRWGLTGIR